MSSLTQSPCDKEDCHHLAVGENSYCIACDQILCREHYDDIAHKCGYNLVSMGKCRLDVILRDIDEDAIRRRVQKPRPDMPCEIKIPKTYEEAAGFTGCYNIHVQVSFEDGVEWLVRISRYGRGDGPVDMFRKTLEGEALTYKLLRDNGIPVAAVHHWGMGEFSKTNNPLCRHLIYDKLPGLSSAEFQVALTDGTMSREDMKEFVESYAAISIKISQIPCTAIGSLARNEGGEITFGPRLNGGYPEDLDAPYFGGPFYTLKDSYLYRIDGLIRLLKKGLIHRTSPLLHYLAFMEARRLVIGDPKMAERESTFYLRHPDCSGGNVMSSGSQITGLVDWEWTSSTSKAAAFASPKWAYESDAWCAGDNSMTPEEVLLWEVYTKKGRSDLAECVRGGRRYQRLDELLFNWSPYRGGRVAVGFLNGMRRAFLGDLAELPQSLSEWIEWAQSMQEGDSELAAVVELDDECRRLRHRRPENVAFENVVIDLGELIADAMKDEI